MAKNYGKKFEAKFQEDFLRSIPGSIATRLPDQVSGYAGSKNICDFICYKYPNIFYIECKSHSGASIPIHNITQYESLKAFQGVPGVIAGVVLWLYEKQTVLFIPIKTITQLITAGESSIGIRHLNNSEYNIIEIPGKLKRTFIDSDYSILIQNNIKEG